MEADDQIAERLRACRQRIRGAAQAAGRKANEVALLAVSKNRDVAAIAAAADAGQTLFGESRVQEALPKIAELRKTRPSLEWHFIGPIQSNKTRAIAENFSWVHSVCRESVAVRLSEQRPQHLGKINVCIQVNTSGEKTKAGVGVTEVAPLLDAVHKLPGLRVHGLMSIPAPAQNIREQFTAFGALQLLYDDLKNRFELDTLSCGMSDDFEAAIGKGSTIVRIGRGIFDPD